MPRRLDGHPKDYWVSEGREHSLIYLEKGRPAAADVPLPGCCWMKQVCGRVLEAENDLHLQIKMSVFRVRYWLKLVRLYGRSVLIQVERQYLTGAAGLMLHECL